MRLALVCDQCQLVRINGTVCHEIGCPNMHARWDATNEQWIKQRECFECGCTVDADSPCCQEEETEEVHVRQRGVCECIDHACPACFGDCTRESTDTLYRIDMEDKTGTDMCDGCAQDALEAGVFTTKEGN